MPSSTALGVLALLLLGPVPALLARARWPVRDPRAGLAAWLAIAVGAALACDAALLSAGLGPILAAQAAEPASFTAWTTHWSADLVPGLALLVAALALAVLQTSALAWVFAHGWARWRQHRDMLDLLGEWDGDLGSVVIDHHVPMAYAVPGRQGVVVLSRACHTLLPDAHVRAVLEHERAHLRGHHTVVLRPLVAWRLSMPWLPAARTALEQARLLVEMIADEAATRATTPQDALAALHRLGSGRGGDLGAGPGLPDEDDARPATFDPESGWQPTASVLSRIRRLLKPPRPLSAAASTALCATAAASVALLGLAVLQLALLLAGLLLSSPDLMALALGV